MATSPSSSFVLSEMVPVLEGLVNLAQEKQEVLVRGDVPGLEEIVRREQRLAEKLNLYEQERVRLLAFSEGFPGDADEEHCLEAVRERATLLRRLNETNQVLIKSSLNIIQHGLRFIMPQAGYDARMSTGPFVFDRRS